MLFQELLHLGGVDVEAAGDDHFLNAGDDLDEAVRLHHSHVTSAEPILVERLILIRDVDVAVEHLATAGQQLARLAVRHGLTEVVRVGHAHFRIRERDADVARAALRGDRVGHEDRARLGQAIALHDLAAGLLLPLQGGVDGQRRCARQGVGNSAQVQVVLFGGGQDLVVQGWHARHVGGGLALQLIHDQRNLRLRQQQQLAAGGYGQRSGQRQAVDVEQWQGGEELLLAALADATDPGLALGNVGHDVAVR